MLGNFQKPFQRHDEPSGKSLMDVIRSVQPTVLLGLTGHPRVFSEGIIREVRTSAPVCCPVIAVDRIAVRFGLFVDGFACGPPHRFPVVESDQPSGMQRRRSVRMDERPLHFCQRISLQACGVQEQDV
jgi:hypothetical protein